MAEELNIVQVESPGDDEWEVIGGGISTFNQEQAGKDHCQRVCFALHSPDQKVVGGLIGAIFWDWFTIELMFIQEEHRGQGYGAKLLALGEEEARRRGARHAHLDTFSFQAPEFYQKHGYRLFGELPDYPGGHTRYYLTKEL
jgi:GNAT superfamily N-acetyltransferase